MKYKISNIKPPGVGKALPLRGVRIPGRRIKKRPDPVTGVKTKGVLPQTYKTKKIRF
jgi:hypothetical protein